eukprot:CAMPEP_0114624364 /NCGR_PEP_ID=MMETSP0168-20121206/10729_1 /TAXON_ID=95228 ORGANISM="Vannella sp., Strain DIVA3 517/6/12" /NCGR_SAMPLE_ID=MMETSP0168 /ASSEMBLY_ACC=CAM_ASM_000044 /LENGTH=554 /DNA_ID=CAMNT_0001835637 /DNA_START=21 /DNA_END=1683 /DNA_ORIENTATION=-
MRRLAPLRAAPSALRTGFCTLVPELPDSHIHAPKAKKPHLPPTNFLLCDNTYKEKTTLELLRASAVMSMCSIDVLVDNSDKLLRWSYKVLGKGITNQLLKWTFFGHFCGGTKESELQPTVERLKKLGVGTIFDYAAENDVVEQPGSENQKRDSARKGVKSARVYDYQGEEECDVNMGMILRSIDTAAATFDHPFVAMKVTALGRPDLLEKLTTILNTIRSLWTNMGGCPNTPMSRIEFEEALGRLGVSLSADQHDTLFNRLDTLQDGKLDYIEWTSYLSLESMIEHGGIFSKSKYKDTVFAKNGLLPLLDDHESDLLANMARRVEKVAQAAADKRVRLLVDAEQTYVQSAIDHLALYLQREHNKEFPVIFNTYQAYLKYSQQRIINDLERSRREGFFFGGKLVRGAYLVLETNRAAEKGLENPILPTIADTHASYNSTMELLFDHIEQVNVMLATHNRESIELAVQLMNEKGLDPGEGNVFFGQLLGMADNLTFPLGLNGYQAYKYVPYGPIEEVVPYLVRRAQENKDMMNQTKGEVSKMMGTSSAASLDGVEG